MTARDQILEVVPAVVDEYGTITVSDVVDELVRRGTQYRESTIRTHITSRMCADAPDNHVTTFDDLVRVVRGRYRLRHP